MTELCERYGVSRNNGHKWRQRFLAEGPAGREERSRARRHQANATPDGVAGYPSGPWGSLNAGFMFATPLRPGP
jgi:hypothetical protein